MANAQRPVTVDIQRQPGPGTKVRVCRDLIVSGPGQLHAAYMPGHEAQVVIRTGDTVALSRLGPGPFAEIVWEGGVWRVHRANLDLPGGPQDGRRDPGGRGHDPTPGDGQRTGG